MNNPKEWGHMKHDEFTDSENDEEMSGEFYLDNQEEPSYELDIGTLDDDDHDKIEEVLTRYSDLFA
ncbi:7194_t:CDS:2 [Dentiscutata erythropus]|uniref:7194_t:CDS:1 n=1 Tax=Dentiscutata erythropus TaxID=1348616 RepID=A0A9N9P2W0_9GLOM|nr:7194_t:CDS:2 [Dentiscutata erythropus]